MSSIGEQVTTVALAIVGVATLAVIVSRNAQTANVISSAGAAFSGALATAVSPVTGFTGAASGLGGLQTANYGFNNFGLSEPYGSMPLYG